LLRRDRAAMTPGKFARMSIAHSTTRHRVWAIRAAMFGFAVVAAALTCALLIQFNVLDRPAALMAGVFVLAAILWITEAVPAYTTSLIIIGLEVLLLVNPAGWPGLGLDGRRSLGTRDVLAAAADPVLVLF